MKRFRIIGKTNQMRSVFLRDPKTGKFVQHKITRGKTIEVNEDELTFHVDRQKGFKILDVVEIPELVEPSVPVEEEPKSEPEAPKKRARGRRRKAESETEEIIDETMENDIANELEGL